MCYNIVMSQRADDGTSGGSGGRPPADYPLQRLTIQATDEELQLIRDTLTTRQRAELLLRVANRNIVQLSKRSNDMTLFYDRDDRSHHPDQDNLRWGQFKKGWNAFVEGNHIDAGILTDRLTYNNLGYRMAATHNAAFTWRQNEPLVRQAYELAVALQAANLEARNGQAPGNRPDANI